MFLWGYVDRCPSLLYDVYDLFILTNLPLKLSIEKRWKQSCLTPNISSKIFFGEKVLERNPKRILTVHIGCRMFKWRIDSYITHNTLGKKLNQSEFFISWKERKTKDLRFLIHYVLCIIQESVLYFVIPLYFVTVGSFLRAFPLIGSRGVDLLSQQRIKTIAKLLCSVPIESVLLLCTFVFRISIMKLFS